MSSDDTTTAVRWDTYVRAQSDAMFKSYADLAMNIRGMKRQNGHG